MNSELNKQLEENIGKFEVLMISDYLLLHPDQIAGLINGMTVSSHNFKKNAGWALFHLAGKEVKGLMQHADSLLQLPMQFHEDIILRNLLFVAYQILRSSPAEVCLSHLDLYDYCMEVLVSECFGPGTRCNALLVMLCFCEAEPVFSSELLLVLDTIYEESSVGLKNRILKSEKLLKRLAESQQNQ